MVLNCACVQGIIAATYRSMRATPISTPRAQAVGTLEQTRGGSIRAAQGEPLAPLHTLLAAMLAIPRARLLINTGMNTVQY
jgi:hypothetical protein